MLRSDKPRGEQTRMSEAHPIQSLPSRLFRETLERLIARLSLREQCGTSGTPYLRLVSQLPVAQGEIGAVRVFTGEPLFRVVTCSLTVEAMQLDSHMLFAFTPKTSAVPHFTLDSVKAGGHFAFHLDLIPRLDLGANLAYMDAAYAPLSPVFEAACELDGLFPAALSPRQRAIMSPWMLANRATESAFQSIETFVEQYQHHWFELLATGIATEAQARATSSELAERNIRNKRILFDPEVDPVWNQIQPLVGAQAVAVLRGLLIGEDE